MKKIYLIIFIFTCISSNCLAAAAYIVDTPEEPRKRIITSVKLETPRSVKKSPIESIHAAFKEFSFVAHGYPKEPPKDIGAHFVALLNTIDKPDEPIAKKACVLFNKLNARLSISGDTRHHKFRDIVAAMVLHHSPDQAKDALDWLKKRATQKGRAQIVFDNIVLPGSKAIEVRTAEPVHADTPTQENTGFCSCFPWFK